MTVRPPAGWLFQVIDVWNDHDYPNTEKSTWSSQCECFLLWSAIKSSFAPSSTYLPEIDRTCAHVPRGCVRVSLSPQLHASPHVFRCFCVWYCFFFFSSWRVRMSAESLCEMIMKDLPCKNMWLGRGERCKAKRETKRLKKTIEEMDSLKWRKRGLPCIAGSLLSSPLLSSPLLSSPLLSPTPSSPSVMDQMLGWVARPEVLPSPLCVLM